MAKLPVNEKFFKEWGSEMSYVLGFVLADGCVYVKRVKKDGAPYYSFNITSKDIGLLEKIKKTLQAQQAILLKKSGNKNGFAFHVQIGSQEICHDLINLGIMPQKTKYLQIIKVPNEYFSDFARGFFDGDGSVYMYTVNGTPQIKVGFVSASLPFINHFNGHLCRFLNISPKAIHKTLSKKAKMTLYSICLYIDDCEKLYNFMYGNNPNLYLERKRKIFEDWQNIKRRHYIKKDYPSKVGWHLNKLARVNLIGS